MENVVVVSQLYAAVEASERTLPPRLASSEFSFLLNTGFASTKIASQSPPCGQFFTGP